LGGALQVQGEAGEALAALEAGLARAPGRERSLVGAALAAEALQRPDAAVAYWERAVAVNPWSAHSRSRLAKLLADRGEWRRALEECRATLRTHPAGAETRLFLALCYLRVGDRDRAREEFDTALALDPSNEEELRRWFAEQAR
jgi:tetratricopeptide (TPR) repeat protein